jgi:hypothetical protein
MLALTRAAAFAVTAIVATASTAAVPIFTRIAETSEAGGPSAFSAIEGPTSLADDGQVYFRGVGLGVPGQSLFRGRGGTPLVFQNSTLYFLGFGGFSAMGGAVSFQANLDSGLVGIYEGSIDSVIAFTAPTPVPPPFAPNYLQISNNVDRNRAGKTVYSALGHANVTGVYVDNILHAPIKIADDNTPGIGTFFFLVGGDINDSGTVLFLAPREPFAGSGEGLFLGNGGPLTPVVAGCSIVPACPQFNSVSTGRLNNHNQVAFDAIEQGSFVRGIYLWDAGTISKVADETGEFASFGPMAIRDDGTVVFVARLDSGGVGLFSGGDPVADRILYTGDPLFGSTVSGSEFTDLFIGNWNVFDQLSFVAHLEDGRTVVVRADFAPVVPGPSRWLVLGAGLLTLLLARGQLPRSGNAEDAPAAS